MDENGNWSFAPAYDITFSYGPGGEHSTTYMGEGKNPTIKHLEKLAKKYNIKNHILTINEVKEAVLKWKHYTKELSINKSIANEIEKNMIC